ncbi:MAG: ABC transporter substrate-binding protein [Clostridiales bacterium]|nr:ABC transporter substrate-binding protein [Roseburia sp.]MDD7635879.1 ABC transporter substrate-binding protein [Clostridiales bacterium]MDY4111415.1 ABC transporter substrate-binding protein [Roseburia sp.]
MRKSFLTLLFCLVSCGIFAACSASDSDAENAKNNNTLVVLNYGKYLDESVIRMFEEETGIQIKLEEYESPEEMYTKFSAGSIDYDVVCTSDYMVERLISEGKVAKIEFSSFSYYENIDPEIIEAAKVFDPEANYSMPYFYGTLGILYNTTKVTEEEVQTWNVLWDEKYKDSIIMQNSVRDTFVPPLRLLGYDINTEDFAQLDTAVQLLIEQKPIVYAYYVDETADEMAAGNAAMALVYSGEAAYAMELNEDLSYCVPKEGSNLWIDSWFIPKSSQNKENAQKFLDFLCREDVAMLNFDYVYYATPNTKVLEQLDDETKNDPTIFPSENILANCVVYKQFSKDTTEHYSYLWKMLKSE